MTAITGFPEWQREYTRLLRRERYTYWRDAKNRLSYYEDAAVIAGESDVAAAVMNRLAVEQAMSALDESERDLVYAVYFEGRSIAAISRSSGVAYRTVGCRLDRALSRARSALERPPRRLCRRDYSEGLKG